MKGRSRSFTLMTSGPALLPAAKGQGGERASVPQLYHHTADTALMCSRHQGELYSAASARSRDHFYPVLQLVMGEASSSECYSQGGTGPFLHSPWISTWCQMAAETRNICRVFSGNMNHSVNTYHYSCMATDPDLTFSGRTGQKFTMASDGRAGYSQRDIPLHPLHLLTLLVLILFCFSFSPIPVREHACLLWRVLFWVGHKADW